MHPVATLPADADDDMAVRLAIGGMDLDTVDFVLQMIVRYGPHMDDMLEQRHKLTSVEPAPS